MKSQVLENKLNLSEEDYLYERDPDIDLIFEESCERYTEKTQEYYKNIMEEDLPF